MKNPNYLFDVYQPADLTKIALQDDEREHILSLSETLAMMGRQSDGDTCYLGTAYVAGEVFEIGGWLMIEPGVAEGFIIPSVTAIQRPKLLVETSRRWVQWLERTMWCHRIQTHTLPLKRMDRWMRALGFLYENQVKRYSETGQDYKLWSREKVDGTWGHIQN